jgi:methionine synthase I (cobalamin-dependent)
VYIETVSAVGGSLPFVDLAAMAQRSRVTVLDGGMGHLIKQWGVVIPGLAYDQQFLAGCLACQEAPDTVVRAHRAYIEAGCDVITTNNFVATLYSLGKVGKAAEHLQYCEVCDL